MSLQKTLWDLNADTHCQLSQTIDGKDMFKLNSMMDLLSRVITIEEVLFVNALSKKEQVVTSLKQFKGIVLDDLTDRASELLKTHLLEINDILYTRENAESAKPERIPENYDFVSEEHLDEIILIIKSLCIKIHEHFFSVTAPKNQFFV